ncbi:MAG: MXAN_5187 C-terminal domain-containing protein [Candidatus Acidiferrales bacterium]
MAAIDEELSQLERDIRTLKIEYEQFFGGGRKRPPTDTQWRVDTVVHRYNERMGELNNSQRFRFNNLSQTYAKYCDMWRKKTMQKETGFEQHHFGAAAKAIEAERKRAAAEWAAAHPESEANVKRGRKGAPQHFATSIGDPEKESGKVQELYRKLMEAREGTGESAGAPSLRDFERFVKQKTHTLKEKGGREIEYTVSVEGGRVKLKARVSR